MNGRKYQITDNKLYSYDGCFKIILSKVDKQFATKIKNELNTKLRKLKNTIHILLEFVDGSDKAEDLIDTLTIILSEIDEQFESKFKDNFDQELAKFEQSLEYIDKLVVKAKIKLAVQAKNGESLIDFDTLKEKIKQRKSNFVK